jgi:hypothetical protein
MRFSKFPHSNVQDKWRWVFLLFVICRPDIFLIIWAILMTKGKWKPAMYLIIISTIWCALVSVGAFTGYKIGETNYPPSRPEQIWGGVALMARGMFIFFNRLYLAPNALEKAGTKYSRVF